MLSYWVVVMCVMSSVHASEIKEPTNQGVSLSTPLCERYRGKEQDLPPKKERHLSVMLIRMIESLMMRVMSFHQAARLIF